MNPEIIAHRGASFLAPENTLAAIILAWELNADAVEIDIYLTKDGRIVAIHDRTTARTTGVDLDQSQSTLEELRALDAGEWMGEQFAGEKIPLLEELLPTIPEGKRMLIEIKCGPEIVPEFMRVINASGKTDDQICVISFYPPVIEAIKREHPEFQAYWLCGPRDGDADELVRIGLSVNADGLDVQDTEAVDTEFVRKVRAAGLSAYVWTVDDPEAAKRLADLGFDGITTNKPDEIRAAVEARG